MDISALSGSGSTLLAKQALNYSIQMCIQWGTPYNFNCILASPLNASMMADYRSNVILAVSD